MIVRDREARRLRVLTGRLQDDRSALVRLDERVREVAGKVAREDPDPVRVTAVALFLHHFYTAIEDILSRIALDLDGFIPAGDEWHRELVEQMLTDVPGVRPAVLDRSSREDLDELRRFRHRVRHGYSMDYDWEKMQSVLEAESRLLEDVTAALDRFEEFLEETIDALEGE